MNLAVVTFPASRWWAVPHTHQELLLTCAQTTTYAQATTYALNNSRASNQDTRKHRKARFFLDRSHRQDGVVTLGTCPSAPEGRRALLTVPGMWSDTERWGIHSFTHYSNKPTLSQAARARRATNTILHYAELDEGHTEASRVLSA